MKKNVSVLLCLMLLLSVMTGCGRSSKNDVNSGDTDINKPGVNDSVVGGENGMVGDDGIANPDVSDSPLTDDIKNGVENAGDAVRRGMDNIGDAVKGAADDMTGR